MWTGRENNFPICLSGQMIPVSKGWGMVGNKLSFFVAKVVHGLGSTFSKGDLGWNLSSCVCLLFLLDQLGPKWQMGDLPSVSLPWKVTSKGAHSQQGWGCRVVLLHATASFGWKTEKRPGFSKRLGFSWFFFLLWKKDFYFGTRSGRCGLYYAEKKCVTCKSLIIPSFLLKIHYILLS